MKAMDVMVRNVITVKPDDTVADAVKLLIGNDISALPVVDDDGGAVVGILSEADLVHREEIDTEKCARGGSRRSRQPRPWQRTSPSRTATR